MANERSESRQDVKAVIKDFIKRSEKSLEIAKETVLSIKVESREIHSAFKHYARNWNDYVHPGLMSIACEAVGGDPASVVPMQVVMLLLTAAADIHDDIIDESKTKYGKATVFGKFGKDIAILVGDALLVRALVLLHELRQKFSEDTLDAIWNVIFSRFFELGEAEALETHVKGNLNVPPEEGFRILGKKASIFEAYARIGAIVGGGDQEAVNLLGNYGKTLGILLFVREDFIDTFEPDELKNRMKNECLPLPILYAFKNPSAKETILGYLSKPEISKKDAETIVDLVFEEENVEMFENQIKRLPEEACSNISILRNEKSKHQLLNLSRSLVEDL